MKIENNNHSQPSNHWKRKCFYFDIVLCFIQTKCTAQTPTLIVDEYVVRYAREQWMSNNMVTTLTSLGAFSPSLSTLTRESTMDEIPYLLNPEFFNNILGNSSNV